MRILQGFIACGLFSCAAYLIYARTPDPVRTAPAGSGETATDQAAERVIPPSDDRPRRIGFDELDLSRLLGINEMPPDVAERLPASIRDLEGKRIVLRGFMKPSDMMEGIPQFLFVRDLGMCCAGPVAKLYHAVAVQLPPGVTTEYLEFTPFDVTGVFRIEPIQFDDGLFVQLYCLDDAEILTK